MASVTYLLSVLQVCYIVTVNPACFFVGSGCSELCRPLKDTKRAKICWWTSLLFVGTQLRRAPPPSSPSSAIQPFFSFNSVASQIYFIDTSSSHCCERCESLWWRGPSTCPCPADFSITCIIWIGSLDNKDICTVNTPLYHIYNPDVTHGWIRSSWGQRKTQTSASPPVPDRAALAPASVNSPSCFRCKEARRPEIVEVHTLCFHIRSVFLYKSKQEKKQVE